MLGGRGLEFISVSYHRVLVERWYNSEIDSQSSTPRLTLDTRRRVYIRMITEKVLIVRKTVWMAIFPPIWFSGLMKLGSTPGGGGTTPCDHCDDMMVLDLEV